VVVVHRLHTQVQKARQSVIYALLLIGALP